MNYQAFTNDSLTMMYEGIPAPADEALKRQGMEARFRVRETPEWKLHPAELDGNARTRNDVRDNRLVRGSDAATFEE
jgi:hypothetical protein